ncbi:single-stranded DNA-binding protein [Ruoffia tabacinasalis]|uniref:single-stranded DNA-binding protein n=1 Tax=Ruoffia tabacinasalis TaxID=87458 RepID=UPI0030D0DAFE
MVNTVQLVGRLTREVDLKFTSSGIAVGTFTIAVNRNFTNQQGEREADFISCVIWRKSAENFANFTRKGSQVGVEGRLQTRNYENQQGQRVYVTEVVVEQFHLLEPRSVTEQRPADTSNNNSGSSYGGGQSYNNNNTQNQQNNYNNNQSSYQNNNSNNNSGGFGNSPFNMEDGTPVDISEDDLPF